MPARIAKRSNGLPAYVGAPERLRASQLERPFVPYLERKPMKQLSFLERIFG